ncbi:MAG: SPOR domain-containing protein [Betaproteobacteria bacterium]|nr:SPOR domain-containing protein [Betaproteobacteria bacterium]
MPDQPEILTAERDMKRRGRRRLIGAITLGLLAFVFVPMFFDDEPKKAGQKAKSEISVQIPPKEGQPVLPAPQGSVAPVTATPAVPPVEPPKVIAPSVEAKAIVPEKTAPKVAAKVEAKPEPKGETKAEPKAAPQPPAKPAAKDKPEPGRGNFAVQVGAFSDADKIKDSIARIKDAGLPHYTENVAVSGGKVTRVRAGPFDTKNNAEAALAKIKLAGGDGKVVAK